MTSHVYSVSKSRSVAEISHSDWCKVVESRAVAGVKYLKTRVTRRQPLYETSVTDI